MIFKGGYSSYGHVLGVLVFKGSSPRIPGDAGNALTFDFPVSYEIVEGRFSDLIDGSEEIKQSLIRSAQKLEAQGVRAVIGDCGLMSLYQRDVAAKLSIPFFSSSLLLLPLIWKIQGETGKIGVVTGHCGYLKQKHLEACGAGTIPVIIQGMEEKDEFRRVVLEGNDTVDVDRMRQNVLDAVEDMLKKSGEIRSVLLECSNLCSFARDIRKTFRLSVYDLIAAAGIIKYSIWPADYSYSIEKFNLL
ncbi:hypothetical protein DXT63_12590 [Thermoanaerobacteraceae bacterium SP2]|nr:hypothetical protein DXT63_12590 [Thermoanaerobacteraceae bacterium SP2]